MGKYTFLGELNYDFAPKQKKLLSIDSYEIVNRLKSIKKVLLLPGHISLREIFYKFIIFDFRNLKVPYKV